MWWQHLHSGLLFTNTGTWPSSRALPHSYLVLHSATLLYDIYVIDIT